MLKSIQKGFTLIELLVVIAIIGILAAVVLIAINPAERIAEAQDSGVKSNLGQIATALENCYTSNGGSYLEGYCDTVANLTSKGYLKSTISDITVVAGATDGDNADGEAMYSEAVAYGVVKAQTNIENNTKCTGTEKAYMTYSTETGDTSKKGVCSDTAPSVD